MNETVAMQELWTGASCQAADRHCRGRLEWHHCLGKNRLKREFKYGAYRSSSEFAWAPLSRSGPPNGGFEFWPDSHLRTLDQILGDTRNRVWLCSHHHELVTNGRLEVALPQSVWEFAKEYGLTAMLENDLKRRAA